VSGGGATDQKRSLTERVVLIRTEQKTCRHFPEKQIHIATAPSACHTGRRGSTVKMVA